MNAQAESVNSFVLSPQRYSILSQGGRPFGGFVMQKRGELILMTVKTHCGQSMVYPLLMAALAVNCSPKQNEAKKTVPAPRVTSSPSALPDPTATDGAIKVDTGANNAIPNANNANSNEANTDKIPSTTPAVPNINAAEVQKSSGCGKPLVDSTPKYVQITSGSTPRQFFLAVTSGYDPNRPQSVFFGIHGRDYNGQKMRNYLNLEKFANPGEIFVYPDGLRRNWSGLGSAIGWQNGPATKHLGGTEDLDFMRAILDYLETHFCVDKKRVFATGQSWGGDFSNVIGCFLGDRFHAFVSVAANSPYYLPVKSGPPCIGSVDAWIMHGKKDPAFSVSVGEDVRNFWVKQNGCPDSSPSPWEIGAGAKTDDNCYVYQGCKRETRYCSYTASTGHQVPSAYYSRVTMEFFHKLP
jgi:poly(3-hydroxybutyrate) depolymerase